MSIRILCLCIAVLSARQVCADYDPPTFQQIVEGSSAIVDATVERLDEEGHPVLKIHGYFKGRNASNTVRGVALSCVDELPSGRLNPSERVVICLWRDLLFEYATVYPVREGPGGELELTYQDARSLETEVLTSAEFRRRVDDAREQAIVKELVDVADLKSPLRWLADGAFDPGEQSVRGWFDQERLPLDDLPTPWTMQMLLEAHHQMMKHAEENPSDDYDEYLRRCLPLNVLAQTGDLRSVIALGEALSSPVEYMPSTAAGTLHAGFGVAPEWWIEHETIVAGAREWWREHEEELRSEVERLIESDATASEQ